MGTLADLVRSVTKAAGWVGVVTVALGVAAVLAPVWTGKAVVVVAGLLLLAAGLLLCMFGWSAREAGRGSAGLILGLVAVTCSVVLLLEPTFGLWIVRWVLLVWFAAGGVSQIALAFRIRPEENWGWLAGGGAVSLLCAVSLFSDWPVTGPRAIGLLVGLHLVSAGVAVVRAHRALERLATVSVAVREKVADA